MHFIKTMHPLIINIRRTPKQRTDDQPPKKLTKLEIVAEEPEHEKYDFHTKVECRICNTAIPSDTGDVTPP
jgi:ubiquitin carboxyl-terminal hydrolase 5/13